MALILLPPVAPSRNIYDVPTLKKQAVINANTAITPETDSTYFGCTFVDEVYGATKPCTYQCIAVPSATAGQPADWKWYRTKNS